MLFVLIVGITRFETVESFPSHDSFSSTSAVVNISQEKNLKSLGFVERLHRRSINDCQTTNNPILTPFCATISSVSNAGYGWEVAKVAQNQSIIFELSTHKRRWFVWQIHVNSSFYVYMFGLHVNSTNQPEKYHFVKNLGNSTLMLSEPQCQPENNLPTIDERCFKGFSSNEWSHVKSGLFVTSKDKNEVPVVLTEDRNLAGKYRLKLEQQNEC